MPDPYLSSSSREPYPIPILHSERHFLVILKPPGVLSQRDRTGEDSVLELLAQQLSRATGKPRVFLAPVHRLDRPVSGAMVIARSSKAASRLATAFREQRVAKLYLAWVSPPPFKREKELVHTLIREPGAARTVARKVEPLPAPLPREKGGQGAAALSYKVVLMQNDRALLLIHPYTGRKHQIRAQLQAEGMPVVGDRRYGSPIPTEGEFILLHSYLLRIPHPLTGEPCTFVAPPLPYFPFPEQAKARLMQELERLSLASSPGRGSPP